MADLSSIKKLLDNDLISRYKKTGDSIFVGELYQRYTHLIFGVCLKYLHQHEDARDASVEIFEHLLIKLKAHEISNFKSWLYSVTRNHCLMKLRKGSNRTELRDDMSGIVESSQEWHLNGTPEKEEQLKQLEENLLLLNDSQRRCIELFYLKEQSYDQVMKHTGFSFKEVKSHIQNGRRNLKIALMQEHERKTS